MEIFAGSVTFKVVVAGALLFGFAPRFATRVITLTWPRGDPRRKELRAEFEEVDYWKRPVWVAELLETALFDGLRARFGRPARPLDIAEVLDRAGVFERILWWWRIESPGPPSQRTVDVPTRVEWWAAYFRARRCEALVRLGLLFFLAGIATAWVGVLGLSPGFPWAVPQVCFGVTLAIVGYFLAIPIIWHYLGAKNGRSKRNLEAFAISLLCLPVFAFWTALRFHPPGPATTKVRMAEFGMWSGWVIATLACVGAFLVVRGSHRHSRKLRTTLIREAARFSGIACIVYASSHIVVSSFAPTVEMRVLLIVTAGLLCLSARESFVAFRHRRAVDLAVRIWEEAAAQ